MFRSYSFFIHASSIEDDGTESPGMTPQVQGSDDARRRLCEKIGADAKEIRHTVEQLAAASDIDTALIKPADVA